MDTLKNKQYAQYEYPCRQTGVPYYYDTKAKRDVSGIGTQMRTDLPWVAHKVSQEDNFDSLALDYYNNPTYWWMIAWFNQVEDPFIHIADHFTVIKIPSLGSIEFNNER